MNFSDEELKIIKKHMYNGVPIWVRAMNIFGDQFESFMKVAEFDDGKFAIYKNCMFLDYSYKLRNRYDCLCAKFKTEYDLNAKNAFIVLEVKDYKGNKIYINGDIDKILNMASCVKTEQQLKESNDCFVMSDKYYKLKKFIGKPICINSKHYILVSVENNGANVLLTVSSAGEDNIIKVTNDDLIVLGCEEDIILPVRT